MARIPPKVRRAPFASSSRHRASEPRQELELPAQQLVCERQACKQAEALLEQKTLELDSTRQMLRQTQEDLKGRLWDLSMMSDLLQKELDKRGQVEAEREAAEAASRHKGEFLANMSHEFRTPMNGIIGMTELALDTDLTPEQQEYLETVKSSAGALLSLLNDILDFSKIEAGKLSLDPVEFSLRDCVGNSIRALSLGAREKGLELACHLSPELPDILVGDPGRLRQVLVNLLANAVKFTERGEVVVEVDAHSEGTNEIRLHFSVADTGIGVPREKHELIFASFTQASTSTTREYGGTGLGLTISSKLVGMMDGRIWLESEVGKGSTFHFTARLGLPDNAMPRIEGVDLLDLPVLVVDGDAPTQRILQEMLSRFGMRPTAVGTGRRALAEIESAAQSGAPYRVVLLDVHMREIDGFELAALIKNRSETARSIVMMLSAGGLRGDGVRCREIGVNGYLTKPVRQNDLVDAIRIAISTAGESHPALVTRHGLREARRRLRILVVDDDPVNRRVASKLLEKRGHSVVVATTGMQALAVLDREPFDFAFMDVEMPEMGGLETVTAIRAKEKATGGHLPIVAATAHAMKGDRERCLRAGMDAYITKPFEAASLFEVIEQLAPASDEPGAHGPANAGSSFASESVGSFE